MSFIFSICVIDRFSRTTTSSSAATKAELSGLAAFAGLVFAFANIGTNVAGNSIPFANDLTGMFPRYVNVRRGQLICAVLGFVICPWEIQVKAARFLSFLNGYTVFLGPLLGGQLCSSLSKPGLHNKIGFAYYLLS